MKFAFILDTSPLMQIKKSVSGEFQSRALTSEQITKNHDEVVKTGSEELKAKEIAFKAQQSTGMSFFEQSVYAIEEFISIRKKAGYYKQDKYFLALTASSPESNCQLGNEQQANPDTEDDGDQLGIDDKFYGIGGLTNPNQDNAYGTKILSSWQHPIRHFMAQLQGLKNPRRHSKIKRTLLDVLQIINAKRFVQGADNRLQGIQLSRIDPCNILLFTASPKMSSSCIDQFMKSSSRIVI
jgi:hypothetical protein